MFGCANCPMMAASRRNLTLSSGTALELSILMATSWEWPPCCHTPLVTVPNSPDPRCPANLVLKRAGSCGGGGADQMERVKWEEERMGESHEMGGDIWGRSCGCHMEVYGGKVVM